MLNNSSVKRCFDHVRIISIFTPNKFVISQTWLFTTFGPMTCGPHYAENITPRRASFQMTNCPNFPRKLGLSWNRTLADSAKGDSANSGFIAPLGPESFGELHSETPVLRSTPQNPLSGLQTRPPQPTQVINLGGRNRRVPSGES